MNGDVYEGDFKDDRMGGYGLYTFSHEGRYEGQWSNAVYEGVGTETFARGSTYNGEYSGGMRNGWGVCRYYNGDYYEGNWKRGLREGRGMQQVLTKWMMCANYFSGSTWQFSCWLTNHAPAIARLTVGNLVFYSALMTAIMLVTTWLGKDMDMVCTAFQMVTGILGNMKEIFPMGMEFTCLPVGRSMRVSGIQGRSMGGAFTPSKQVWKMKLNVIFIIITAQLRDQLVITEISTSLWTSLGVALDLQNMDNGREKPVSLDPWRR